MVQAPALPAGFELPLEARLQQRLWEIASFPELKTVWRPLGL